MDIQLEKTKYSNCIGQLDNQVIISDCPIPKSSFVWIISGKRGSGKTSLIFSLLDNKWRNRYDSIYLVSQTARNDSHSKKVLKDLIEELEPEGKFYEDINEEVASEILEKIQLSNDNSEKPLKHLLILDDCISSIPKNKLNSKINRFFINNRHYKLDTIVVTQKLNSLSTLLRTNTTLISMFSNRNRKDINTMVEDLDIPENLFRELYAFATEDSPNHFLHINLIGKEPIFYKRFDKILLSS